jgi:hypothetical protein
MPGLVHHLLEAIQINRERMPRYSDLSGGQSLWISRQLILSEILSLPFGAFTDAWGRKFQKHGIPIVLEEYVPMRLGAFQDQVARPTEPFERYDGRALGHRLKGAWKRGRFDAVDALATSEIARLQDQPFFHCMVRHLLESVLRISRLAPLHDDLARSKGIASSLRLSAWMLWTHFPLFDSASRIDAQCAPLQARGIPILAQDLPVIPPDSDFYSRLNKV